MTRTNKIGKSGFVHLERYQFRSFGTIQRDLDDPHKSRRAVSSVWNDTQKTGMTRTNQDVQRSDDKSTARGTFSADI